MSDVDILDEELLRDLAGLKKVEQMRVVQRLRKLRNSHDKPHGFSSAPGEIKDLSKQLDETASCQRKAEIWAEFALNNQLSDADMRSILGRHDVGRGPGGDRGCPWNEKQTEGRVAHLFEKLELVTKKIEDILLAFHPNPENNGQSQ